MKEIETVNIEKIKYYSDPFPHFHISEILNPHVALMLLQWMETSAPWELVVTDFYEQYEFSLHNIEIPEHLSFLKDGSFAPSVLDKMINTFNLPFANNLEIVAHKLVPGQTIRIHNDYQECGETHRLVIQLNSGWTINDGGVFIVFSSANVEDIHHIITPQHNSAVGFSISSYSHHAVSTIYNNARYSLVCSIKS